MTSTADEKRVKRWIASAALLALCVATFSCAQLFPRQSWSRKWGPMVPHETFPGDCGICHIPEDWKTIRTSFHYDHEKETGFALEGAHARAACLRCHNDRGPVAMYVQRGCGGCHADPHLGALGLECKKCHNQETWEPIGLIADHANTRFPLVASHAIAPCEACHERATAGYYSGAPVECALCHQEEAWKASPNHVVNQWFDCKNCHTPASWKAIDFNHDFFPLQGGHAGLGCGQCHPGERFTPISTDCYSCHQNDYVNAPNHVSSGYSTNCTDCHNTNAWN